MQVTRDLLPELKQSIFDSIDGADFIALACEFSGVRISKSNTPQSPDQQYKETKAAAECFSVIQMGLCLTRWSHNLQHYEASLYNFYVSPTLFSRFNENLLSRKVEFEAAAIEYDPDRIISSDQLFRQGVFYLNEQEEAKLRQDFLKNREIIKADNEGFKFLKNAFTEIYTWKHDSCEWKLPFVNVDTPNDFLQRLLCQELEIRSEFDFETRPGFIQITSKRSKDDRRLLKPAGFEGKIDKAKGLRNILDYIGKSGKPLVGHNVLEDLVCIYSRLIKGSLPETLAEFCKAILDTFPKILDTKVLAHKANILGDKSAGATLQDIMTWSNELQRKGPTCQPEFLQYLSREQNNEAGYDAIVTAKIFAHLCSRIPALTLPGWMLSSRSDTSTFQLSEVRTLKSFAYKWSSNPIRPFSDPTWRNYFNMVSLNGITGPGILDVSKTASSFQSKFKGLQVNAEEFIARRFLLARPIKPSILSNPQKTRKRNLDVYSLNANPVLRNIKYCKQKQHDTTKCIWKLPPIALSRPNCYIHTNSLPPIQTFQQMNTHYQRPNSPSRPMQNSIILPRPGSLNRPHFHIHKPA